MLFEDSMGVVDLYVLRAWLCGKEPMDLLDCDEFSNMLNFKVSVAGVFSFICLLNGLSSLME